MVIVSDRLIDNLTHFLWPCIGLLWGGDTVICLSVCPLGDPTVGHDVSQTLFVSIQYSQSKKLSERKVKKKELRLVSLLETNNFIIYIFF